MDIVQPYSPPGSDLPPLPTATPALPYATRTQRLLAYLADGAVLVVPFVFFVVALLFGFIGYFADFAWMKSITVFAESTKSFLVLCIGVAILSGMAILFISAYNLRLMMNSGQTIGKKLLKIKVLRSDGSRLGIWRWILLRSLPIALLGALPGHFHHLGWVGFLVDSGAIFFDHRYCIHDLIADTVVVKISR